MATLLMPDGSETVVYPTGQYFTLEELYQHLACDMVQMIPLFDGYTLWGDEEAYLREPRPPANERATALYHQAGGIPDWDVLGRALICSPTEVE